MKKLSTALLAAVVAAISFSSFADATVLTFEDVAAKSGSRLSASYGGLDWSNLNVAERSSYKDVNTTGLGSEVGYFTGAASGTNTVYNPNGLAATISSHSSFDFEGAFFTSAWSDKNAVTAKGYRDGNLVYSKTVKINTKGPTWLDAAFTDIDSLTLASSKWQFAMDDFTFLQSSPIPVPATVREATPAPVPEPSTLLLAAAGIFCAAFIRRRWRV